MLHVLGNYRQIVCSSCRSNDDIAKARVLASSFGFILHRSSDASDNSIHLQDTIIKSTSDKIQPERKPFCFFRATTAI